MMRKYHVRFGGGARVPEGSPALPYLIETAPCRYPTQPPRGRPLPPPAGWSRIRLGPGSPARTPPPDSCLHGERLQA